MKKITVLALCGLTVIGSSLAEEPCKGPDGDGSSSGGGTVAQSCDPNEISGPLGIGEARYVQQGEWMDYTIYFENKTNATAAAQEVFVDLPMDANLDWSTLELGEIAFGEHIDTSFVEKKLAGKSKLTSSYAMPGTNTSVKTEVKMKDGVLSWYMRDWDPTTADNFPASATGGFLPPNDPETHCGEGHLSFRVKVKSDAPDGAIIRASAQIVFDSNPMIETDPSWWNTVGEDRPMANFTTNEVEAVEGENTALTISGGNADRSSSVKVYLTYNTVAAADIDLKTAAVSSTGSLPVQEGNAQAARSTGLKFPLLLTWEKGEMREKVITIPVKTDKTVEGDEFLTLQLAEAEGMELGEERVCTVTIRDMNDKTLKTTVTPYKPKKDETVTTNMVGVAVAPGGETGGFVAGTGEYTSGSKLTLTAEARPGWTFVGWRLSSTGGSPVLDGEILSNKAKWQVVVTNDEEYVAVFEKIPYVRGLADPADGGKVSGSGQCAAGKKVTLKATMNKNFTFVGWTTNAARSVIAPYQDGDFVATTASLVIDRSAKPAANSKTSTTITEIDGDVTYYAVFKSDPKVTVSVEDTDEKGAVPTGKGAGKYVAGTITGEGKYAPGKKVTLKATANKNYVFAGWVRGGPRGTALPDDGGHAGRVTLPDDMISQAASLSFEIPSNDVEYVAMFVTAEEDKGSIALAVNGTEMRLAGDGSPHQTNIWAGVYLEWPVAASALSETKVKVAGLPTGLKFTDKPVTSKIGSGKTAIVVTNVLANTIYGAPTAASKTKVDKNTGAVTVTPSAVKVTVTTAGKSSQTYQIDTVVEPLPAWAQGTFAGVMVATDETSVVPVAGSSTDGTSVVPVNGQDARSPSGVVSLAIDAKGKISGRALGDGTTWTLSAPWFDEARLAGDCSPHQDPDSGSLMSEVGSPVFIATVIGKSGKLIATNVIEVAAEDVAAAVAGQPPYRRGVVTAAAWGHAALPDDGHAGRVTLPEWTAWQYNWKVEPWKALGKKFDKKVQVYAIREDGTFIDGDEAAAAALGAEIVGRVTLKFAASGAVSVAGEFVAGYDEKKEKYTIVKATGSATLVPVDEEKGTVFIYLTPKGLAPHARCVDVLWPQE